MRLGGELARCDNIVNQEKTISELPTVKIDGRLPENQECDPRELLWNTLGNHLTIVGNSLDRKQINSADGLSNEIDQLNKTILASWIEIKKGIDRLEQGIENTSSHPSHRHVKSTLAAMKMHLGTINWQHLQTEDARVLIKPEFFLQFENTYR